jgi:hypothetical protein
MINRRQSRPTQLQIPRNISIIFQNIFSHSEESGLVKGLNFSVMYPLSILNIASAVESLALKVSQTLGMEFGVENQVHVKEDLVFMA